MSDELSMDEILAQSVEAKPGNMVDGVVVSESGDYLLVDVGLKQEASLSKNEFSSNTPKVGENISVLLVRMRGPEGRPLVSWKQAREKKNWDQVFSSFQSKQVVEAKITKRVKGGLQVDVGLDAFMPASQIDERPVNKPEEWVGKTVRVLVLEMDRSKGNVLVSRRRVIEEEKSVKRAATMENLKVDQVVKGRVTSLTSFGAFIDIGGIEGLLHISDMSWVKNETPKQILKVGDEIDVKVLKFDASTSRISLGRKQLLPHPWDGIESRHAVGSLVKGKVTAFASFGAFVEIEPGVDGLLHLTELSWTQRVKSPKEILKQGQEIEAKVIDLDRGQEKISLSLKRLETNPWEEAAKIYPAGTAIEGEVTHVTSFGAFVKTPLGIEALLKNQDISWTEKSQTASQIAKVGEKIKAVVVEIDSKKEKMSVGLRQLSDDPLKSLRVGQAVTGTISKITDFGLFVKLESGLEGLIRSNEIQHNKSMFGGGKPAQDANSKEALSQFKEGDKITASITKIIRKDRKLDLSVRRYERDQERQLLKKYSSQSGRPTLGEATGWLDDIK